MGWTQDQEQRDQYDQFHGGDEETYEREMENLRVYRQTDERGWQGRLELDAGLDGLDESDYTIGDDGNIRPKTSQELFMRDYGVYLGVIGVFLLFR